MRHLGASQEAWEYFSRQLGLTGHLLPAAADPAAPIAANSTLSPASLGKIPSRYNARGEVVGFGRWTEVPITAAMVRPWSVGRLYNLCVRGEGCHAFDFDVDDVMLLTELLIRLPAGLQYDVRRRKNSFHILIPFRVRGPALRKRVIALEGKQRVELLGAGQQWIGAGHHPSGEDFFWQGGLPGPRVVPSVDSETLERLWAAWERIGETNRGEAEAEGGEGRNVALRDAVWRWFKEGLLIGEIRERAHSMNDGFTISLEGKEVDGIIDGTVSRHPEAEEGACSPQEFEVLPQEAASAGAADNSDKWIPPPMFTPGADFDPSKIELRRWLLGKRRAIGEVTCDAGPPGVNKSMLLLTDAVAIATGRQLIGDEVYVRGHVLYLAGEDSQRDVLARLAAILQRYGISPAELGGRLHIVCRPNLEKPQAYTLGHMERDVAVLNQAMVSWLRRIPDVVAVFIDPQAAWSQLLEASNEAMAMFTGALKHIAANERHVGFDHHVTKASMTDSEAHVRNLAAVRGGGALIGEARWAFTLAKLNPTTARELGIPEREARKYRRFDPLKASYGDDDLPLRVFRIESIQIANTESVGVLTEIDLQTIKVQAAERRVQSEAEQQEDLQSALLEMLKEASPRSLSQAANWLATRRPYSCLGEKGKPLSAGSIRNQLPIWIGGGILTAEGLITLRPGQRRAQELHLDKAKGQSHVELHVSCT